MASNFTTPDNYGIPGQGHSPIKNSLSLNISSIPNQGISGIMHFTGSDSDHKGFFTLERSSGMVFSVDYESSSGNITTYGNAGSLKKNSAGGIFAGTDMEWSVGVSLYFINNSTLQTLIYVYQFDTPSSLFLTNTITYDNSTLSRTGTDYMLTFGSPLDTEDRITGVMVGDYAYNEKELKRTVEE